MRWLNGTRIDKFTIQDETCSIILDSYMYLAYNYSNFVGLVQGVLISPIRVLKQLSALGFQDKYGLEHAMMCLWAS